MGNGKLALVMPTYRFDATARHCIETAASMACDDIEIFVGDNSCNPEKWALLRKLADRSPNFHAYCHETNIGGAANWVFLMERQHHEYLCMLSDDDVFSPDYFMAGLEELKANPACAAAGGLLLVLTWRGGQLGFEPATSNLGSTPPERISNFVNFNTIAYAVHRRADVDLYHAYLRERPFFPSYLDQFMTYALLAQGSQVVRSQRQVFLYNNNNWSDAATCIASDARFYVAAKLPEQFVHLHHVGWAVDAVHYFNSIYRPSNLTDAEAQAIAQILFHRHLGQYFRPHLAAHVTEIGALFEHAPEVVASLQALLLTPFDQPHRLVELFVAILHAFSAELAEAYKAFALGSLRSRERLERKAS